MRVGVDARACVGYLLELARLQISPRALNLNSTVATGSSSIFCSVGKSSLGALSERFLHGGWKTEGHVTSTHARSVSLSFTGSTLWY